MFTVLGVFGGLTALFTRLEDASYLAAISFVLFLLLDFELWIKFPKSEEASLRLKFFEVFMQMLLFAIGIYIVQAYTDFVYAFMPIIVMLIFGAVFFKLFEKFEVVKPIRRISQKSERFKTIILTVIAASLILILLVLGLSVGNWVVQLIKQHFVLFC